MAQDSFLLLAKIYNLKKVFYIFSLLFGYTLLPQSSFGQTCSGQSTVYAENFGSGDNSIALTNGASSFSFQSYSLSSGQYKLNRKSNAATGWHTTTDHTSNYKGRMMLADASNGTVNIFADTITQLSSNNMYTLSFAVMNVSNNTQTSAIKVQLQAEYLNTSGQFVSLGNYNSEWLPATSNPSWNVVGGYFTLPSGTNTIRYTLKNIAGSSAGNFIAVDDIQLLQCASSSAALLPTILKTFEGSMRNEHAWLRWETADETGLQNFEIEKSSNGKQWNVIQQLKPLTSNGQASSYSWEDLNPLEASNYYRLRMIHQDGIITYSSIVMVRNTAISTLAVRLNNPMHQQLEFSCLSNTNTSAQLILRSLQGKIILQQNISLTPGANNFKLPLSNAAMAGIYIIDLTTPQGYRFTDKVIKN